MPETLEKPRPLLEWRKNKAESLKGLERRVYATGEMELRESDDGVLHLTGYASVTDTPYEVGFYTETIRRNAFARTLSEAPDVVLLLNHEGLPLARTKAGTLRLTEDDHGLKVDADLDPIDPDTIVLKRKRDRGDLDGQMSMAFQVTSQKWDDDYTHREVISLSLARGDVSVVTHGASPTTSSNVRANSAALALSDLGPEVLVAAFREWRNFTLLPLEQRAGKTLSAATMDVLTQIAALMTSADDALDEAIPALAELMGVPDPDTDSEAGDSVERSIDSEKGLHRAIRSALRTPDGDEERAAITARAAELDLPGLVPDCWGDGGSLAEGRALETQEQRETFNDTYTALQGALDDVLVTNGDYYYVWIQDFDESNVYYVVRGELYSAPYTLVPGGEVTIDTEAAAKVRPVTEYVERAAEPGEDEPEPEPEPEPVARAVQPLPDFSVRARQRAEVQRAKGGRR